MDDRLCIDYLVGKSQIRLCYFDFSSMVRISLMKNGSVNTHKSNELENSFFRGYRMDHLWKCAPLGMGPSQNLWAQYLGDGNVPAILKFTRVPMGFDH